MAFLLSMKFRVWEPIRNRLLFVMGRFGWALGVVGTREY